VLSVSVGFGFSAVGFAGWGVAAGLRELGLSHRFLGEIRESSEVPRVELFREEDLPLEKLGSPTRKSRPDITAAIAFLPCRALVGAFSFSCAWPAWLARL
jgi:hypothetical protein